MIRAKFDEALEKYARGDLVQARTGFEGILKLQPEDKEARALLNNTVQALNLRADLLIEQAGSQIVARDLVAARASLAKAQHLVPDHLGLATVQGQIAQQELASAEAAKEARRAARNQVTPPAIVETAPVAPASPSYASLSAKEKLEVADLYQKGLGAVENDRHDDAIRYWELVWSRAPDYQQVAENLKQEYLVQGMEAFAKGRLDQSIEIWERAENVAPGDPRTRGYLTRAYEHKSRIREIKGDR